MSDKSTAPPQRLFGWLWRKYLSPHWVWLIIALAFMAVEGASLGIFAATMEPMFDRVFVEGDRDALLSVGLVILAVFLARAVTSWSQRVILTRINALTAAALRGDLLAHLMRLDGSFHQANPPGYLIERVQGDVTAINQIWSGIITGLGRDLVSVIALFGVALSIDWLWTVIALVGIPVLILPSFIVQGYVRRRARSSREIAGRMSTRLDEVFHGIAPIKLNSLEAYQSRRYDALIDQRVSAEVKTAAGQAGIPALIDVMTGLGFLGVLIYGGSEIIAGDKTVGQFVAFFTSMSLAFEPLRRLGNISGLWQAAAASIERIKSLFDAEPTLVSPSDPVPAPKDAPSIELQDVHLTYGDLPVLNGASFVAEAGKTTALVGASGAGKSTVFNLLTRLVDPSSGSATIGGVPTAAMALADLRGMISVVTQDALLFDETVRENVLLGQTDISEDRLSEVLDAAHVSDFLPNLPLGLNSPAGPRGSALSGGQRQRVAIARALLRDTPILLLDEATSALDTKSEAIVQQALDRLSQGRTTLVIAHRLSTVRAAHKIVVMEAGRVVDQGTHEELLARGGLYADLYALQFNSDG
ncbi:ABC transporter ATP-binding protein [Flavimaricola marinus]|uniref:Putative multidrug export ATP-binding/permease protein n=1 Tax=Flavimaricola marinus TaxID=1819565 RepID=A0A238LHU1_9RHOB|nr:ABC transporter ATP-binding protein [Flavimaricola marinus]SMY08965.1 Putative multidrug export ATP-binding/permease protein [Flavimaricola marinus]